MNDYELKDTRVETGGVFRCCHATVAEEYENQRVAIGAKSKCRHCGEPFTLTQGERFPLWKPDWQLADSPEPTPEQ